MVWTSEGKANGSSQHQQKVGALLISIGHLGISRQPWLKDDPHDSENAPKGFCSKMQSSIIERHQEDAPAASRRTAEADLTPIRRLELMGWVAKRKGNSVPSSLRPHRWHSSRTHHSAKEHKLVLCDEQRHLIGATKWTNEQKYKRPFSGVSLDLAQNHLAAVKAS